MERPPVAEPAPGEPQPDQAPMLVAAIHEPLTTKEEIQAEIIRVFGRDAENALCIAQHESGFRADATGSNTDGSYDRGVFQLNSRWQNHIGDDEAYNARANIARAKEILDSWGNWNAWSTRQLCGL